MDVGPANPDVSAESNSPEPLPAVQGHMLKRDERGRLVSAALATQDQDHEDLLRRTKERFERYQY